MNIAHTLKQQLPKLRIGERFESLDLLPLYGISTSEWIRGGETRLAVSHGYAYSIKLINGIQHQNHIVTTSNPQPNTLLEILCNASIAQKMSGTIYYGDIVIPPFIFIGLLSTEQIRFVRKYIAEHA